LTRSEVDTNARNDWDNPWRNLSATGLSFGLAHNRLTGVLRDFDKMFANGRTTRYLSPNHPLSVFPFSFFLVLQAMVRALRSAIAKSPSLLGRGPAGRYLVERG
jgi:hypothetical protein